MRTLFNILAVISASILTLSVLVQSRGAGLGASFGGEGGVYRSRRGPEKVLFNTTIISAVIFVLATILGILSKA